jgi:hypothetical protein
LRHSISANRVPVVLPLTAESKQLWVEFYNEHGREQAGLTGDEAAAWSKLEGYAARFALILQLCLNPMATAVDAEAVRAGIAVSRWFGHEARRVYAVLVETEAERERRHLVELIERHGGEITTGALQASYRPFRNDSTLAEKALQALVRDGLGSWVEKPPGPKGGRPATVFRLTHSVSRQPNPSDPQFFAGFTDADTDNGPTPNDGDQNWTF